MGDSKALPILGAIGLVLLLPLLIVLILLLAVLGGLDSADAQCAQRAEDKPMMAWPTDRHEIDGEWTVFHQGYDFAAEEDSKVYASHDGKVVMAADNEIRIRMTSQNEDTVSVEGVETRYKYLKTITVNKDAQVKRGDPIGTVGTGSEGSDGQGAPIGLVGAHLHWEMWVDQENKNDWSIVPPPEENNPFVLQASEGGSACSCVDGNLSGANNQQKAFNFFVQNGYSKEQAAGIVGNMISESSVEPGRLQGTSPGTVTMPSEVLETELGWGIVQWTPARKMVNPARDEGVQDEMIASLGYQLEFLLKQLRGEGPLPEGEAGQALASATTVEDAAYQFGYKFERFAGSEDPTHERYAERKANARHVYDEFAGSAPSSGGDSGAANANNASASTGGCGAGSGNIAEVAKSLAWTNEGGHDSQPYKDAATQAYKENFHKYNDAPESDDIAWTDCGRFVATVMHMSGADPDYPDVYTPTQEQYLRNSPKYEVHDDWDESKLQPGDILIGPGHTYIYVGPWGDDEAYNSATASLDGPADGPGHVPEATTAYAVGTTYAVARLKNAPAPAS